VFKTTIPLSAKIEESCSRGITVLDHAPSSAGAMAYLQLVEEITHGRSKQRRGAKAVGSPGAIDAA
jgi:hypothetical protein